MTKTQSAFKGCLAGLALGDALGAPFEGLGPDLSEGFEAFLKSLPLLLNYTDDTEMAIGVAESLAERHGLDPDHMARRFAENFNPRRGYGPGTIAVMEMIAKGIPWQEANRAVFPEGSFGNGAAMRIAPVGLFFAKEPAKLREATFDASSITHDHPLAKEGALIIAHAAGAIVRGDEDKDILDELLRLVTADLYREKLLTIKEFLGHPIADDSVIERLGHSVLAHESAPTALYAYMLKGKDYLKTIRYCVSLGGDTDTISAMAGALSGARVGIEGIPIQLLERLEDGCRLLRLAERLYETASNI